MVLRGRLPNAR